MGVSAPSLHIESTDSMIVVFVIDHFVLYAAVTSMNQRTAALLISALALLSTVAWGQGKFI